MSTKELEGQLQRLRQVLVDMLAVAQGPPDGSWPDWQERFHAAFLYLHQSGCVLGRPEFKRQTDSLLLSPNADAAEPSIPDVFLRTKMDNVRYCNDAIEKHSIRPRAAALLERIDSAHTSDAIASSTSSRTTPMPEDDFTLLTRYYTGQ